MSKDDNIFTITRGEDRKIPASLIEEDECENESCFKIEADPTDIRAFFNRKDEDEGVNPVIIPKADIILSNPGGGEIEIKMSAANSALLAEGVRQSFEVEVVQNAETKYFCFDSALTVKARKFPGA